jgi:hypothetical protein
VSEYLPTELRRQIRDHFRGCCAYCRSAEELTVAIFEVEHVIPRSAGGSSVFSNLCLACPTCNRYKGSRTTARDPRTGDTAPLFQPHRDTWNTHFAWNEDATEITGLTPIGRVTVEALRMNRRQLVRVRRMWTAMGVHPPET